MPPGARCANDAAWRAPARRGRQQPPGQPVPSRHHPRPRGGDAAATVGSRDALRPPNSLVRPGRSARCRPRLESTLAGCGTPGTLTARRARRASATRRRCKPTSRASRYGGTLPAADFSADVALARREYYTESVLSGCLAKARQEPHSGTAASVASGWSSPAAASCAGSFGGGGDHCRRSWMTSR